MACVILSNVFIAEDCKHSRPVLLDRLVCSVIVHRFSGHGK